MSEDTINQEVIETPAQANDTPPAKEYSEVEKRALEMGWVPKEEYSGDPDRWKSAEVFVALDEPIKRIESQSQEIKAVKKALSALQEHHSKVRETEYKRAMTDLKAARRQAYLDGDIDKVEQLEEKIDEFKEQAEALKTPSIDVAPEPGPAPEFVAWMNRNPWYSQYSYMAAFADDLGPKLLAQGYSKPEILKKVEEEVRKEFPNKFRNPNKDSASAVEAGGTKPSGGKKSDIELTEQERKIMNTLVHSGVITKEKYIADLRKVKGLE